MNVIKLTDIHNTCDYCNYSSESMTVFKIHINTSALVLCEECKHELTFELISN